METELFFCTFKLNELKLFEDYVEPSAQEAIFQNYFLQLILEILVILLGFGQH